ncbi:T9SS type A sorting domain-containing protein, partial [Rubrivirga sp.]|uniref:T9SS type A sorting domain-containing protein n=1 Tax=Rubrivirga sp. TaxID=1885344 RepID=UPI003C75BD7A
LEAGEPVIVPLVVTVPEAGTYEIALLNEPMNVDNRPVIVEVFNGTVPDVLTGDTPFVFVANEGDDLTGRFSVRVSLGTAVNEEGSAATEEVALRVWPNPSAGRTSIALEGMSGDVRVALYDQLGREVAVFHDGAAVGTIEAAIEAGELAPGAYVLRATTDGEVLTRSFTVVR